MSRCTSAWPWYADRPGDGPHVGRGGYRRADGFAGDRFRHPHDGEHGVVLRHEPWEFLGELGVGVARRGRRRRAQAGQPLGNVAGESRLGELPVTRDVDADFGLLAHDGSDARLHLLLEPGLVDFLAGDFQQDILEHLGRANEAADMGRQDPVDAAFHGSPPRASARFLGRNFRNTVRDARSSRRCRQS